MMPSHLDRPPSILDDIYRLANSGVWALATACFLWLAINMPAMLDAQQRAQSERAQQSAAEDGAYCEKWGISKATARYATCLQDLAVLRERILRTAAETDDFF